MGLLIPKRQWRTTGTLRCSPAQDVNWSLPSSKSTYAAGTLNSTHISSQSRPVHDSNQTSTCRHQLRASSVHVIRVLGLVFCGKALSKHHTLQRLCWRRYICTHRKRNGKCYIGSIKLLRCRLLASDFPGSCSHQVVLDVLCRRLCF